MSRAIADSQTAVLKKINAMQEWFLFLANPLMVSPERMAGRVIVEVN